MISDNTKLMVRKTGEIGFSLVPVKFLEVGDRIYGIDQYDMSNTFDDTGKLKEGFFKVLVIKECKPKERLIWIMSDKDSIFVDRDQYIMNDEFGCLEKAENVLFEFNPVVKDNEIRRAMLIEAAPNEKYYQIQVEDDVAYWANGFYLDGDYLERDDMISDCCRY